MQTSTQTPPAPAPPPTPPVSITTVGADGKPQTLTIPQTTAEVRELLSRRGELSDQLNSASERRSELSEQIRVAPDGVSRAGLEDRIRVLDQRILQLEKDIGVVGSQLAAAPAGLVESTQEARVSGGDTFGEGFAAGGFSVFFASVLFFLFMRRRWRRRSPGRASQTAVDSSQRLERLEHGMDAIAVEIERISEGQRFVTKVLSESHGPIGASNRIAQPVAIGQEDLPQR
jgi:hypothetical protein